jgi:hypothetical protein
MRDWVLSIAPKSQSVVRAEEGHFIVRVFGIWFEDLTRKRYLTEKRIK